MGEQVLMGTRGSASVLCSKCGERPIHTRGLCSTCYQRTRRSKRRIPVPPWERRTVTLVYCPRDKALGVPMYPYPCYFPRLQFMETLAEGYWPDGVTIEFSIDYRGAKTRWRIDGQFIFEIGTDRVAEATFSPGQHVVVRLVNAEGGERKVTR